jgi:hypothetical protein
MSGNVLVRPGFVNCQGDGNDVLFREVNDGEEVFRYVILKP